MPYPQNFGLVEQDLRPTDYILGADTQVSNNQVLQPDGHGWKAFLPSKEVQGNGFFDSFGCVSFSALNCLETLFKRKYALSTDWSDRYTCILSGTKPGVGNHLTAVGDSIRKVNGFVPQSTWPNILDNPKTTLDQFYLPVPQLVQDEGKKYISTWLVQYEFVTPTTPNLLFALQYAPLQVIGFAWRTEGDKYVTPPGYKANHAFTLFDYVLNDYWIIFDHYDKDIKKLVWDYSFGAALKYSISEVASIPAASLGPAVNLPMLNTLRNAGFQYVQRSQALGQVYRLDTAGITFLDSNKDPITKSIPLVGEVLARLVKEKKLTGISEVDYQKLTNK